MAGGTRTLQTRRDGRELAATYSGVAEQGVPSSYRWLTPVGGVSRFKPTHRYRQYLYHYLSCTALVCMLPNARAYRRQHRRGRAGYRLPATDVRATYREQFSGADTTCRVGQFGAKRTRGYGSLLAKHDVPANH